MPGEAEEEIGGEDAGTDPDGKWVSGGTVSDGYPPADTGYHPEEETNYLPPEAGCPDPELMRETLDKWLGPVERLDDEIHGRSEAAKLDPPGGWAPGIELASTVGLPRAPEPTYRQVGVRLKWAQYTDLAQAARIYGLAPTTLARALINRGTRAILDEYRREGLLSPPPPPPQPPRSESGA